MSDVAGTYGDPLPVCEVPDCGRHVWGSETVCRPHLLTGVTAEKIERRRAMQEAAAAVIGGDDSARKADLLALAAELSVDVKPSWTAEKITAAIDAARTKTDDPVVDLASADLTAPDPALMQAAQVTGVPDSTAVTNQEENSDG